MRKLSARDLKPEPLLRRVRKCQARGQVRKRLLLVLPHGDKYLYVCPDCGSTCGETIETPSQSKVQGLTLPRRCGTQEGFHIR